jgi:hypothetical protein
VAFLASQDASYITGVESFHIEGPPFPFDKAINFPVGLSRVACSVIFSVDTNRILAREL